MVFLDFIHTPIHLWWNKIFSRIDRYLRKVFFLAQKKTRPNAPLSQSLDNFLISVETLNEIKLLPELWSKQNNEIDYKKYVQLFGVEFLKEDLLIAGSGVMVDDGGEPHILYNDPKLLWEFGRLNHLLHDIFRCVVATEKRDSCKKLCDDLFRFIASNPPTNGPHWASTMDVGIRAANIAMMLNLLVGHKKFGLSKESEERIAGYLYSHIQFIRRFPEKKEGLGNNHYLANLVGLIYAANPLKLDNYLKKSIQWAVKELLTELDKQFLDDGGNFESSTTYHCLSTEMAIYGLAMIDRMRHSREYDWLEIQEGRLNKIKVKIKKASDMIDWLVHDNDQIVQMGDNDSGRFFKWSTYGESLSVKEVKEKYSNLDALVSGWNKDDNYFDEDMLNQRAILDLSKGYFSKDKQESIEGILIQQIRGEFDHNNLSYTLAEPSLKNDESTTFDYEERNFMIDQGDKKKSLIGNLTHRFFPNMGVYVFRSDRLHLVINGMNRHVKQYWPHGHNDKLSFELYLDGEPIVRDPGSFTYTGDYKLRNLYRSEKAHNVPRHSEPQNKWPDGKEGVFRMIPKSKVEVVDFSPNSLTLHLRFGKVRHIRTWVIHSNKLEILDKSNKPFETEMIPDILFSNGYGKMLNKGY